MRAHELLHKFFNTTCEIDKRIKKTLFVAAESLIACRNLSINALGRSLSSKAHVKHCIKRIDRLFGNETLHKKGSIFYKILCDYNLKNNSRPIIIINGSGLTPCGKFHFLRAATPAEGRTITLYDEVHTFSTLVSAKLTTHFPARTFYFTLATNNDLSIL